MKIILIFCKISFLLQKYKNYLHQVVHIWELQYYVHTHTYTRCIIKIRTNFNLNFWLYCARGCCWHPRKPDAFSKQSYILKMATILKPSSAEYNQRAAIIYSSGTLLILLSKMKCACAK